MPYKCLKCFNSNLERSKIVRHGCYYRSSDSTWVQRFRCLGCRTSHSTATFSSCYRQKKRHKNEILRRLFASKVSQNRAAQIVVVNRKTAVRKFRFLSLNSEFSLHERNLRQPKASVIEFDDMETFEHTKCKPLSITLAVESGSRRILALEVSSMAAKGRLSQMALEKYGQRRDERTEGRRRMLRRLKRLVVENVEIKTDSNPYYAKDIKEFFPSAVHRMYKGRRGSLTGSGELKKVRFDPLFSLNHTCACIRDNVNRLVRKTWATTKRPDHLYAHLMIYANYHNLKLAKH